MMKKQKRLTKGRVRTGLIIGSAVAACLFSFVAIWWQDVEPIEDDYTVADLRSAPPDCNGSYQLLLSIARQDFDANGAPEIGLTAEDVNQLYELTNFYRYNNNHEHDHDNHILANAAVIERIWQNAEKGRKVFEELNAFNEIADLTEPNLLQKPVDYNSNLRKVMMIYGLKARLLLSQDDSVQTIENLALINSIFRKYMLNTRTMINKMVGIAGLAFSIKLANDISNHPEVSQDEIELLAAIFSPLSSEITSMRNPAIFEYLSLRQYMLEGPESKRFRANPFCKVNSSLRLYRNYMLHGLIQSEPESECKDPNLRVCSGLWGRDIHLKLDKGADFIRRYLLYNPMGSLFTNIALPGIYQIIELRTKLHIQDDLLQIVINKRLGRPVDLKARAYSDEYIIDTDKKIIFSPGPDGISYTDDDIKFDINPDVLNLSSSGQEQ